MMIVVSWLLIAETILHHYTHVCIYIFRNTCIYGYVFDKLLKRENM